MYLSYAKIDEAELQLWNCNVTSVDDTRAGKKSPHPNLPATEAASADH